MYFRQIRRNGSVLIFVFSLTFSCGSAVKSLNPQDYRVETMEEWKIPEACIDIYTSELPSLAVVRITNRTNIPQVDKLLEELFINSMANLGSAKVFTRAEVEKILEEHRFQISTNEEENLIRIGKLAGVNYILTGSVNSIRLVREQIKDSKDFNFFLDVELTVRMLDINNGQVVFSQVPKHRVLIVRSQAPPDEGKVNTVMRDLLRQVSVEIGEELYDRWFRARGTILQIRSSKDGGSKIALINIGKRMGLSEGQQLLVFGLEEIKNPVSRKPYCNVLPINVKARVSDKVLTDTSWVILEGKRSELDKVRVGFLVEVPPKTKPVRSSTRISPF